MSEQPSAAPSRAPVAWSSVQARLHVMADGNAGPVTYAALMSAVAGQAVSATTAAPYAVHIPAYGVDATPARLSAFMGQCCHESLRFARQRELWGPTAYQKAYDAPGNRLGNHPGDGFPFRGAGPIEVTGRYWFTTIGHNLGRDLVGQPSLLDDPETGVLVTLEWWRINGMNAIADTGDATAVTRKINPGLLGLAERVAFTNIAKGLLS